MIRTSVELLTTVEYVSGDIEAKQLRAIFDLARLNSPIGPESPELTVTRTADGELLPLYIGVQTGNVVSIGT